MALIKTLKDFLTKTVIYPTTKTNAVYDDTVGRLDTYLTNTLGAEPIDDVEEETAELRDADTLGGRYTAEDLDAMPKSSAVEDYANVEPPIVDADYLNGHKAEEFFFKNEFVEFSNDKVTRYGNTVAGTSETATVTKTFTVKKSGVYFLFININPMKSGQGGYSTGIILSDGASFGNGSSFPSTGGYSPCSTMCVYPLKVGDVVTFSATGATGSRNFNTCGAFRVSTE